ncbi:hypothetical protein MBANPS3_011347, partial [Mucor bainieri]
LSLKLSLITGKSCLVTPWKRVTRSTISFVPSVRERVSRKIFLVSITTMISF